MRKACVAGAAALFLGSCGGGDAEPLDCAWAAADNCWKQLVREISTCTASTDTGTFNADRTACTYPDGIMVTFDEPVPAEPVGDDSYLWRFTLERGGNTCVRYEEGQSSVEVTGPNGGVLRASGSLSSFTLDCPDGTTYRTGNPLALFSCEGDSVVIPSTTAASSGAFVSVGLAAPPDVDGNLFGCEDP